MAITKLTRRIVTAVAVVAGVALTAAACTTADGETSGTTATPDVTLSDVLSIEEAVDFVIEYSDIDMNEFCGAVGDVDAFGLTDVGADFFAREFEAGFTDDELAEIGFTGAEVYDEMTSRCDGDETPSSAPASIPDLPALRQGCEDGDMAACDELFFESPIGSIDEAFGDSCGGRNEPAGLCTEIHG